MATVEKTSDARHTGQSKSQGEARILLSHLPWKVYETFRDMEERINCLDMDSALKERCRSSRHNFNSYLDKPPSVPIEGAGVDYRRPIFMAFLYGVFAHANPKRRKEIKEWEKKPYFDDIQAQFHRILLEYLKALSAMANVCREYLRVADE